VDVKEVQNHNGKDGKPSFIVYKNKVYDVSNSKMWKSGTHVNRHSAGEDLTDFMSMAPHGPEVLERVKQVDTFEDMVKEKDNKLIYQQLYNKFHPHPVLLHYPMGVLPFGFLMLVLYIVTGYESLEPASYYALIFGTVCLLPVVATGILSWWLNYQTMMTKIFSIKLYLSIVVIILCTSSVVLHQYSQTISFNNWASIAYCVTYFAAIPCLFTIAFNGGKITWPS
jgi:predicted heme/steroid binding protein/uncharacterized membrane protein